MKTVIDASDVWSLAVQDLKIGLVSPQLWWHFAVHDVKQRFRRSTFGPFWITLSMGIMVAALGSVFSQVFDQTLDYFIPYLATGLIFWGFLSSVINEGCTAFIVSESHIKNVPMPLSVHYYRVFARNVIVWLHNMVIYVIVFLLFQQTISINMIWFVFGFSLFLSNIFLLGLIVAILSTRYRDIPQIVSNVLQVIFFITPVFWLVDLLPSRPALVLLNPFFHLIEIVRMPLLNGMPAIESWFCSVLTLFVLMLVSALLYRRSYTRIPYWV